jgi:iron complex transport system ATP-binding protein
VSSVAGSITIKNLLAGFHSAKPICSVAALELRREAVTVLCGPNGAGKSTLLKTIANQIPPLSGEILIDGVSLPEMNRREAARRLAYVPQFAETRRSLTVSEWVALGRNPHQHWWSWRASAEDQAKIEDALRRTDCLSLRDKTIETLSGGERQRVLIATALAQEPAYMLMDEPTAHLDFRHQLELLDLFKSLKNEGLGILVVLHDLNLSARIADSVLMLKKDAEAPGYVRAEGSVANVFSHDILKDVYGVEMEVLSNADGSLTSFVARSLKA